MKAKGRILYTLDIRKEKYDIQIQIPDNIVEGTLVLLEGANQVLDELVSKKDTSFNEERFQIMLKTLNLIKEEFIESYKIIQLEKINKK